MSRSGSMAENTVSNSLPPSSAQSKVTVGGSGIASGGTGAMHHHHHHLHHHHHNHHKSMDMGGTGKAGGGSKHHTNVIHRTTSESLRLGGGGAGSGSSMNNSVSGSGTGSTMGTAGGGGNGNIGSNENSVSSSSMLNSSTSANSISRKSGSSSASGGGGAGHGGAGGGIGGAAGPGGKTSSFTITSVIVGPGKHSADNGDDSADDLDESHTDDNSRITDFENETPSFSEDTFSKEDVFFTNAIGSVPVIPTSSQYGLAIVAPNDRTHGGEVLADAMHVSVTDGGINIMGHGKGEMSDGKELHHRNERFKVVKIESTEPFKRGRWVCMDYLDHTTLQQPKEISTGAEGNEAGGGTNATVTTQDSGVGMNDNASFAPSDGTIASEIPSMDYHPNAVSSSPVVVGSSVASSTSTTTASNVSSALHGMLNNESPGQSLNLPLASGNTNGGGGTGTAGNTTTSHVQSNTTGQGSGTVGGGAGIPHSLPQTQLQNALAGQQPPQPNAAYSQGQQGQSQYYPHTMTNLADLNQQSVSNPQAHQHHQHGATLPSNMQIHPQTQPPQQQQQQQPPQQPSNSAVSSSNILPPLVASIPTSQEMNIIINNPTIQSSFPSPHQQFKPQQPQQSASQTNSPVVVPTSLLDNTTTVSGAPGESVPLNSATTGATILSPSAGSGNAVSAISTTGGGSAHDTAGSVSIVTDPLMNASPSATSSPVTSSAQIIPQPATFAPPPGGAGASAASIGDPSSTVAQNTTAAANNSVANGSNNTAAGSSTTTNGTNCVVAAGSPSSTGAIGSASSIPVATVAGSSGTDPLSSEAKLLSAVSGVTAGTVAGDGEDPEKANAEDGESSSGLQAQQQQQPLQSLPSATPQQQQQLSANAFSDANASNDNFQNASLDRGVMLAAQQPQQMPQQQTPQQYQQYHAPLYHDNAEKLSKAYSLPPSMSATAKESLRKELAQSRLEQQQQQQHAARKFQPVARAFNVVITSSSTAGTANPPSTTHVSGQANTSNIYTDIALGKSIQNLMKPTPILATALSNRLTGGSLTRSIGALGPCHELPEGTASQEATGYCRAASSLLGNFTGSNSVSACTATHPHRCVQDLIKEELGGNRLSKAGSMINMSTDSDLFITGGSQSHPASGRSSPAFMQGTTPVGSPPRFVNTLGPSYSGSGGGSARVSRAASPSVLHTSAGGEHASASGTSAVAIDNKIEQAMDLVKSHLMFAVREEVEVLKERISELMDRINQLEYENNILKANASQETLAQLTTGGSNVPAATTGTAAAQQQVTTASTANAGSTKVPTSSANPANGSVS